MPSEFFDVMIVGSGPAGTSTALHLLQRDPAWGSRLLILEKERHPREKLCGGGLTRYGESLLGELGVLPLGVPHVNIREVRLRFEELTLVIHRDPIFRRVPGSAGGELPESRRSRRRVGDDLGGMVQDPRPERAQ